MADRRRSSKSGFSFTEIMTVAIILLLLAAIAIPNFITARAKAQLVACQTNAKEIQDALEQYYAVNRNIKNMEETELTEALVGGGYLQKMPVCPAKGTYYTDPGGIVCCSVHQQGETPKGGSSWPGPV